LHQNFSSKQNELDVKKQQIDQVQRTYQQTKHDLDDITEVIHREREDLMDRIRELTREIRLKHLIIDQFVPA
jgi:kinesin family protein 3/17